MAKISMILDSDFPPDPRVENEAITLIENGWEVSLLSLSTNQSHKEYEVINGIQVYRKIIATLSYKLSALAYTYPLYHWLVQRKIKDFLEETKPDYIHIHDMQIARAVFNVNKEKLPVVLDLHENRPEIMKHYPHLKSGLGKLLINPAKWKEWQSKLVQKADGVITVTELAKQQLIDESGIEPSKVFVVPNTIKKEVFYSYSMDQLIHDRFKDKQFLLYLGDTGLRRGTDTAIRAMAELISKFPDLLLVLVGKSRDDKYLKQLAADLKIQDSIVFEGWQDLKLFPSYISAATIALSPIKRNPHHDTTYANKLFQYMAYGKPLVVSDCPAQADLIMKINSGLVHEASSSDDLAQKVDNLISNEELRLKLGENGRNAIESDYDWQTTAKDLVELYQKI